MDKRRINKHSLKHGHAIGYKFTKTYRAWADMLSRCCNPNVKNYKDYGGRGIQVVKHWWDFKNFLEDMGEAPPDKSLDRIDNNWHYMPSNCRWATRQEQNSNKKKVYGMTINVSPVEDSDED